MAGTVAWITPHGAQGGKTQGIGVHFSADESSKVLRSRIEQAEPLPQVHLTVSIGVAMQRVARRADEWLRAADAALYEAKRNGRNRVET